MALALLRLRSCDCALALELVLSRSCVGFLRIALAPLHLFAFESSDLSCAQRLMYARYCTPLSCDHTHTSSSGGIVYMTSGEAELGFVRGVRCFLLHVCWGNALRCPFSFVELALLHVRSCVIALTLLRICGV